MDLTRELQDLAKDVEYINDTDKNFLKLIFADVVDLIKKRKQPAEQELLIKTGFLDPSGKIPRDTRYFYRLLLESFWENVSFNEPKVEFLRNFLSSRAEQSQRALAA